MYDVFKEVNQQYDLNENIHECLKDLADQVIGKSSLMYKQMLWSLWVKTKITLKNVLVRVEFETKSCIHSVHICIDEIRYYDAETCELMNVSIHLFKESKEEILTSYFHMRQKPPVFFNAQHIKMHLKTEESGPVSLHLDIQGYHWIVESYFIQCLIKAKNAYWSSSKTGLERVLSNEEIQKFDSQILEEQNDLPEDEMFFSVTQEDNIVPEISSREIQEVQIRMTGGHIWIINEGHKVTLSQVKGDMPMTSNYVSGECDVFISLLEKKVEVSHLSLDMKYYVGEDRLEEVEVEPSDEEEEEEEESDLEKGFYTLSILRLDEGFTLTYFMDTYRLGVKIDANILTFGTTQLNLPDILIQCMQWIQEGLSSDVIESSSDASSVECEVYIKDVTYIIRFPSNEVPFVLEEKLYILAKDVHICYAQSKLDILIKSIEGHMIQPYLHVFGIKDPTKILILLSPFEESKERIEGPFASTLKVFEDRFMLPDILKEKELRAFKDHIMKTSLTLYIVEIPNLKVQIDRATYLLLMGMFLGESVKKEKQMPLTFDTQYTFSCRIQEIDILTTPDDVLENQYKIHMEDLEYMMIHDVQGTLDSYHVIRLSKNNLCIKHVSEEKIRVELHCPMNEEHPCVEMVYKTYYNEVRESMDALFKMDVHETEFLVHSQSLSMIKDLKYLFMLPDDDVPKERHTLHWKHMEICVKDSILKSSTPSGLSVLFQIGKLYLDREYTSLDQDLSFNLLLVDSYGFLSDTEAGNTEQDLSCNKNPIFKSHRYVGYRSIVHIDYLDAEYISSNTCQVVSFSNEYCKIEFTLSADALTTLNQLVDEFQEPFDPSELVRPHESAVEEPWSDLDEEITFNLEDYEKIELVLDASFILCLKGLNVSIQWVLPSMSYVWQTGEKDGLYMEFEGIKLLYLTDLESQTHITFSISDASLRDQNPNSKFDYLLCKDPIQEQHENIFKFEWKTASQNSKLATNLNVEVAPLMFTFPTYLVDDLVKFYSIVSLISQRSSPVQHDGDKTIVSLFSITDIQCLIRVDGSPLNINQLSFAQLSKLTIIPSQTLLLEGGCMEDVPLSHIGYYLYDVWKPALSANKVLYSLLQVEGISNLVMSIPRLLTVPIHEKRKGKPFFKSFSSHSGRTFSQLSSHLFSFMSLVTSSAVNVLQLGEHVIRGDFSNSHHSIFADQPSNVSEGVHQGYEALGKEMQETKEMFLGIHTEYHDRGVIKATARTGQATLLLFLKTLKGTISGANKVLFGVRNALNHDNKVMNDFVYKKRERRR